MSNIKTLPKFKVGQRVYFPPVEGVIVFVHITERHETSLGWLYEIDGGPGYYGEQHLMNADETMGSNEDDSFDLELRVNVPAMLEAHQKAKFKPGDYVRISPELELTSDERYNNAYAIVVGSTYYNGLLSYDLGILHQETEEFFDDPMPFDEDDLIGVSAEEVAGRLSIKRSKPELSVVR